MRALAFFLFLFTALHALPQDLLFKRLDPFSLSELLSFYHLYPDTPLGNQALSQAWKLLQNSEKSAEQTALTLPPLDIEQIITLITRSSSATPQKLSEQHLQIIEKLSETLPHKQLLGAHIWNKSTLDKLAITDIDLGRGLLICQFENEPDKTDRIRKYEALLDLMALQIRARLPKNPTNQDKVKSINAFIFHEMNFRFPPHASYAKNIDEYTFLPSVLDTRQGVCLGVSILYLCLAQRLSLPLEIITPPGHIYIRLNENGIHTNIETTARGIHTPTESYLGVGTHTLPKRTLREVLGMVYYNHASLCWDTREFKQAIPLYEKALHYLPDDLHTQMLLALSHLLAGNKKQGRALLKTHTPWIFPEAVSPEILIDDILTKKISIRGLQAIFAPIDHTRTSILNKQKQLLTLVKTYPKCRSALFHLATTYLQLGREKEAFEILQTYYTLDQTDVTVTYYLAILATERMHYSKAWTYLLQAQALTARHNYHPKILHNLKQHLKRLSPLPPNIWNTDRQELPHHSLIYPGKNSLNCACNEAGTTSSIPALSYIKK